MAWLWAWQTIHSFMLILYLNRRRMSERFQSPKWICLDNLPWTMLIRSVTISKYVGNKIYLSIGILKSSNFDLIRVQGFSQSTASLVWTLIVKLRVLSHVLVNFWISLQTSREDREIGSVNRNGLDHPATRHCITFFCTERLPRDSSKTPKRLPRDSWKTPERLH